MSAPAPSYSRSHRRWRRIAAVTGVLALVAGLLLAAAAGWVYSVERAALPQVDGSLRVAGLNAPATVVRDRLGVPHITASNMNDLMLAQGYVTAQDRLWQMDLIRRYAAGELAEVLGPSVVKIDRRARILGLRRAAEQGVAALTPDEHERVEAYARGVNAYIESHRDRLSLEFHLLRYEPRPWTVQDSLSLGAFFGDMLGLNLWEVKVTHENVVAKLGPEAAKWLYDTPSWRDHAPGDDASHVEGSAGSGSTLLQAPADALREQLARRAVAVLDVPLPGSNNWVVSGAHTASGKPLLANDMHLGHQLPNVWYVVDLKAGDFHVAGVSAPGAPFVIVGHNDHIAWGDTNLGPDVQDVFVENFNGKGEYQSPQGWRRAEHRREVIHVKGQSDVVLDVVTTRHGPIISELIPGETRKLALQWTLYEPGGIKLPFDKVNAARNWQEFLEAWRPMVAPAQNIVYADDQGHIGYRAMGRVPVRAHDTGMLPVSGADDEHEWTGCVPFEQMPTAFDPPSGVIATANADVTPRGYSHYITSMWEKPYRTQRIYRVLQSKAKLTPADMLKLQTDVYSDFDRVLAERLVYAVDHASGASARAKQAADLMRGWNGELSTESAAPTVVQRSLRELWNLILGPKLGEPVANRKGAVQPANYDWARGPVALENILLRRPQALLPAGYASYDALLAAAVEKAIAEKDAPANLAAWKWGTVAKVEVEHPVFGNVPLLRRWTGTGVLAQSGNSNTVKQVGRAFGPSQRMTVEFANFDASTLNIVNGESGNFLSDHYNDQWQAWYGGTTFAWPWSDGAVQKAAAHTLVLEPVASR